MSSSAAQEINLKAWDSTLKTSEYRVYPIRWLMLGLFCSVTLTNAMQWITYSPIARYVMNHYQISTFELNALSFVYMIVYIPFFYFSSYITDVRGLRAGITIGAVLNCIGAWIRYIGKDSDKFYLAILGQSIAALAQCFTLGVPPKLAANWFPIDQRARATSIGALFNEVGVASGFLLSPSIVKGADDIPKLLLIQAIMCTAAGSLVITFFRGEPPTPPSVQAAIPKENFKKAIRSLSNNRPFVLLVLSFGSTTGAFYAVSTVLDQVIEHSGYTPDDAGWLGFIMIIGGIIGGMSVGYLSDKTKKYRALLISTYCATAFTLVGLILCIRPNFKVPLYIMAGLFGASVLGTLPVSLEGAAECAFPVSEAIAGGTTMMSAQLFGIIFIVILSVLSDQGVLSLLNGSWTLLTFVALSCILMFFFKENRIHELQSLDGGELTTIENSKESSTPPIIIANPTDGDMDVIPLNDV